MYHERHVVDVLEIAVTGNLQGWSVTSRRIPCASLQPISVCSCPWAAGDQLFATQGSVHFLESSTSRAVGIAHSLLDLVLSLSIQTSCSFLFKDSMFHGFLSSKHLGAERLGHSLLFTGLMRAGVSGVKCKFVYQGIRLCRSLPLALQGLNSGKGGAHGLGCRVSVRVSVCVCLGLVHRPPPLDPGRHAQGLSL